MSSDEMDSQLTDDERHKVAAEVDYFMAVLLRRYGLSEADLPEVIQSLRWLKEHRDFMTKLQTGGSLSLIALLISALAAAVWAGVKTLIGVGAK